MSTALLTRGSSDRAFERLYRRHVHDVYRYVLAVLRNPADAEDATQATFLSAFRAFAAGEEPRKPRNWLLKIAHNECRQRFRASSRRPTEVEWDERTASPTPDESVPSADEIRTALGHLSLNQRSALVMRELEGRTYAEIAEILDLSASAVETLLFRARRALREQLEGELTCGEAESALSRRMDKRLATGEQGALRAHLRACPECAALERKQRARRTAVKGLGAVQLPPSLASFFGGTSSVTGGAVASSALAAKGAAVVAAGVLAGGAHEAGQALTAREPARAPQSAMRQTQSSVSIAARGPATVPRRANAKQGDSAHGTSPTRAREAVKAAPGRRSKGQRGDASPEAPPTSGGGPGTGSSPGSAPTGNPKAPAPAAEGGSQPVAPQPAAPQPVRAVVEPVVQPVVETVKAVVEPVVETVKQVVEPVVETVKQVVEPIVEPVKRVVPPLPPPLPVEVPQLPPLPPLPLLPPPPSLP